MRTKRATITDVARQAGVSKATVSAVLNDTGSVKDSTRERVVAAMELLNYRQARLGAARAAGAGRSIGLLIKEFDNPYYSQVALGAHEFAASRGYTLVVASSEGSYEAERRAVELLQSRDVDGLIATPVVDDDGDLSHFFELKRRNFPFVLLEAVRGVRASLVDVDNEEASRQAVVHLIEQGHTQIVHFAGPSYSMHSQERVDGVRRACSASHLIFSDEDVIPAGAHLEDGYRAGLEYFRGRRAGQRPTAVTCYNDLVAVGVYRALNELGLRVPDDISLIGFDDLPLIEYLPVPLTTLRMPKERMGQLAAELLIGHIEAREVIPPTRLLLEAPLIVRASTRAIGGKRRPSARGGIRSRATTALP